MGGLPERHRLLLLRDDLSFLRFNVLVLGKGGGERCDALEGAVQLVADMEREAEAFARRAGWSAQVRLFYEVYPHASCDALYLHIVDLRDPKTGGEVALPPELRAELIPGRGGALRPQDGAQC